MTAAGQRRALVTGGSSGIGAAFARALSADGFAVAVVARDGSALRSVAEGLPGPVDVIEADLAREDGLARVERWVSEHTPELLVNNAATGTFGPFLDQAADGIVDTVAVNAGAAACLARAALPAMAAAGRGGLITVSSPAGARPAPGLAVYGATKAFLDALDATLRVELRSTGVVITTVWPGYTRTRFHERLRQRVDDVPEQDWTDPDTVARTALRAHRAGASTVRVPRPTARQSALETVRAARHSVPDPARRLVRRARLLLRVSRR